MLTLFSLVRYVLTAVNSATSVTGIVIICYTIIVKLVTKLTWVDKTYLIYPQEVRKVKSSVSSRATCPLAGGLARRTNRLKRHELKQTQRPPNLEDRSPPSHKVGLYNLLTGTNMQ